MVQKKWLAFWIVVFGGVFAVGEGVALINDEPGDTLSESVRYLIDQNPYGVGAFIAFMVWFFWHILFQGRKKDKPGDEE